MNETSELTELEKIARKENLLELHHYNLTVFIETFFGIKKPDNLTNKEWVDEYYNKTKWA